MCPVGFESACALDGSHDNFQRRNLHSSRTTGEKEKKSKEVEEGGRGWNQKLAGNKDERFCFRVGVDDCVAQTPPIHSALVALEPTAASSEDFLSFLRQSCTNSLNRACTNAL